MPGLLDVPKGAKVFEVFFGKNGFGCSRGLYLGEMLVENRAQAIPGVGFLLRKIDSFVGVALEIVELNGPRPEVEYELVSPGDHAPKLRQLISAAEVGAFRDVRAPSRIAFEKPREGTTFTGG